LLQGRHHHDNLSSTLEASLLLNNISPKKIEMPK
jgi:hypothetical protein